MTSDLHARLEQALSERDEARADAERIAALNPHSGVGLLRLVKAERERDDARADNAALLQCIAAIESALRHGASHAQLVEAMQPCKSLNPGAALLRELLALRRAVDRMREAVRDPTRSFGYGGIETGMDFHGEEYTELMDACAEADAAREI